jgi:hypothetical protein
MPTIEPIPHSTPTTEATKDAIAMVLVPDAAGGP